MIFIVAGLCGLTNALMLPLLMELRALSGTMIPDVIPGHDAQTLSYIFTSYGASGMEMYEKVALYDIVYPLGYSLLFGCLIYLLWSNSTIKHLAWIPVVAALFDYMENYYLATMLDDLSNIDPGLASLTGNIVTIKMLLIGTTMLIIVTGTIKKFMFNRGNWSKATAQSGN